MYCKSPESRLNPLELEGSFLEDSPCYVLVINTSCPRAFAEDIWWRKADFGKLSEENCPFGSTGNYVMLFCSEKVLRIY